MQPLSRRSLLACGAAALVAHACGSDADPPVANANLPDFVQPEIARSNDLELVVKYSHQKIGESTARLRGFNGRLPGPTIRVRPGDTLRIRVKNELPPNSDPLPSNPNTPHQFNTTNLHPHGLHVDPQGNSDNVFVEIEPGDSFQYEFKIPQDHPPGTMFYHPHKHGSSAMQMLSGMAGLLILEGGLDDVPEIRAARDLVYLMNEINFNSQGEVAEWTSLFPFHFADRRLLINGQLRPTLTALSGEVLRLRVVNAGIQTVMAFGIDGHQLQVIALDGIALPQMRTVDTLVLTPAGRADVLITCGAPGHYDMNKRLNSDFFEDGPVKLSTLQILDASLPMSLPAALPGAPYRSISEQELTQPLPTVLTLDEGNALDVPPPGFGNFSVDRRHFDKNRVDHTIPLNSVLEWELVNNTESAHPFHIHVNPFMVVSVNDVPLPEPEWHDTFAVPAFGRIRIRHRFQDFRGLYVLHCHIFYHEDLGMMQTVNVV